MNAIEREVVRDLAIKCGEDVRFAIMRPIELAMGDPQHVDIPIITFGLTTALALLHATALRCNNYNEAKATAFTDSVVAFVREKIAKESEHLAKASL